MGSKKTVQSNEPPKWATPYIMENLQQQQDVFKATQPDLMNYAGNQRDTYGRVAPGAEQGIMGAQGLVNRTLGGEFLQQGNPYLNAVLAPARQNVINSVNDQFGPAGRFGSASHATSLANALYDKEMGIRYGDYAQERAYQNQAVGDAQNMMGGAQGLLNNAAELPWTGVMAANGAVKQASGGYGTQTQKQSGGLGQMLGGIVGTGLGGWASGGFR